MGTSGAAGVGFGGLRLEANRARLRGLTAWAARFPGVENRPPGRPIAPRRDFSGIPGIPAISQIRPISRISATLDPATRSGWLQWGPRAPRRSDLGGCDWRPSGPDFGGWSSRSSVPWCWVPASHVSCPPPNMVFRVFPGFPLCPKFAKFPEFPLRRILRPGTGRHYGGPGRRGIWGVAIGGKPGPISGATILRSSVFWGR